VRLKLNKDCIISKKQNTKKQNAKAIPPSGADIVAQCYGANSNKNQLLFIDFSKKEITPLPYFSDDIKLYILHTGIKIQTHEHLSDKIKENFPYAKLIDEVHNALNSIKQHNPTALGQVMNTYASILQKAGYMAEHTKEHLNVIQKMPGVLGAKGCGAMGSDVLLVLLKNNVREEFKKLCLSRNLRLVATI